jgi:hypothetical protein
MKKKNNNNTGIPIDGNNGKLFFDARMLVSSSSKDLLKLLC